MTNRRKYKIYADFITFPDKSAADEQEISYKTMVRRDDNTFGIFPKKDYYINVPLYRRTSTPEYADISIQDGVNTIQRQNFNPYFIEVGFFEDIEKNKISKGSELTSSHISFIRERRNDINTLYPSGQTFNVGGNVVSSDERIRIWFDEVGKNELPWNVDGPNETTINELDLVVINTKNIVSKSSIYPIDINN